VLQSFGRPHTDHATSGPTHIFNLGHGISQFTPPDHVAALVAAARPGTGQLKDEGREWFDSSRSLRRRGERCVGGRQVSAPSAWDFGRRPGQTV